MRISKDDVPVKISAPGATARQKTGLGDASGYARMGGEIFNLAAGTDITPLLQGLEGDLCQSPHWGFMVGGDVTVTYGDGSAETLRAGDLFFLPEGHTVRAETDTEFVLFSPEHEHTAVMDHINRKLNS